MLEGIFGVRVAQHEQIICPGSEGATEKRAVTDRGRFTNDLIDGRHASRVLSGFEQRVGFGQAHL